MKDKKLTMTENIKGLMLVAKEYHKFKKLAKSVIEKNDDLTEDDFNDVVISLIVTKLLVEQGVLDEKFFESAIS